MMKILLHQVVAGKLYSVISNKIIFDIVLCHRQIAVALLLYCIHKEQ